MYKRQVDIYTRQCSLSVTAHDLAVMGATLADGGVNPLTGEQVVSAEVSRDTLSVLASCGMYERSGEWLFEIGLPAKSGVSGGIVAVSPGKGAVGAVSYTHLDVYKRQAEQRAIGHAVGERRASVLGIAQIGTCLLYTSRCV